jgi:hypothetical protein
MPTYQNNTSYTITDKGVKIAPGETVATTKILTNANLTRTANTPYQEVVTEVAVSTATNVTYPINVNKWSTLMLLRFGGDLNVELNGASGSGLMNLKASDDPVVIKLSGEIESVKFTSNSGTSTCVMRLIR